MNKRSLQTLLIAAAAGALAACAGEEAQEEASAASSEAEMTAETETAGGAQSAAGTASAPPEETASAAPAAADDPVTGMCLYYEKGEEEACACATERFRDAEDAAGFYAAIAAAFLAEDAALSTADRWQNAVNAAAEKEGVSTTKVLTQSTALGKAHREAMKACGL